MLVYRIQDSTGMGPYWADNRPMADRHNYNNRKWPMAKFYFDAKSDHYYCFAKKVDLLNWFHDLNDLYDLDRSGFKVYTYEVPSEHVLQDDRQAAFIYQKGKIVDVENVLHFTFQARASLYPKL